MKAVGLEVTPSNPAVQFDDWYNLIAQAHLPPAEARYFEPLHTLWIRSFQYRESGYSGNGSTLLLGDLFRLLAELRYALCRRGVYKLKQWEKVYAYLATYAVALRSSYKHRVQSTSLTQVPLPTGSTWDIIPEELTLDSTGVETYVAGGTRPFRVQVSPEGFVDEDGFAGYWNWTLHDSGRFVLEIGGDMPVGWGWFTQVHQQEMYVYFYEESYPRAFERMRWVRSA